MRRLVLLAAVLVLTATSLHAQIPQNVISVMQKCNQTMNDDAQGMQVNMEMKMSYLVISIKGDIVAYSKGNKNLTTFNTKMLGRTMRVESGCDGKQNWHYDLVTNGKGEKEEPDTLLITPIDQKVKKKDDFSLEFDMYKDYKKAEMKEKNGKYEITFTQPKKADSPKKMMVLINKSNYQLYEMSTKEKGATMRMTVKSIKKGVPDSVFVLDPKKFPSAKVVHKS